MICFKSKLTTLALMIIVFGIKDFTQNQNFEFRSNILIICFGNV